MYTSIVIHLLKERYENSKGILTIDKLNKALKYYKSKSDSDTAYVETAIKYPGILELMDAAYVADYTKESAIFHILWSLVDY
ncbi:hypothetical protein FDJ70_02785 [Clostridium botulinum]|uniref:Uncharacterized protein n=1 Tax=Clostridium botulinum D str. 1873 TaxID=592027 RepID=A0A9P2LL50_CLOBO|nr:MULTISPECIES: hypothetical protein [Clostridium]EES91105.1 conserved hypothetical protein [Clostridium botulinum D str. 1873]MBO3441558.1 hypothetical protein [Clostridium haemolyticum]NFV46615.1 hypothetical protein [Clostridium botulinum]OOV60350.1 hypothetical protein B1A68_02145 [Clostridium botulinum D/C]QPW55721.1 hypothetical protein IRP61_01380 [Clostridium botulinum]